MRRGQHVALLAAGEGKMGLLGLSSPRRHHPIWLGCVTALGCGVLLVFCLGTGLSCASKWMSCRCFHAGGASLLN